MKAIKNMKTVIKWCLKKMKYLMTKSPKLIGFLEILLLNIIPHVFSSQPNLLNVIFNEFYDNNITMSSQVYLRNVI